jgi:hypothetical protein
MAARPPRRRKYTGLKIMLAVLAALTVLAAIGVYLIARPFLAEYPATLTAPDQVAGLTRLTDPAVQQSVDGLSARIRTDTHSTNAIAAMYAPDGDRRHLVMLAGATGLNLNPGADLDKVLAGMAKGAGSPLSDVHPVPAGALGGNVRCGSSSMAVNGASVPVAMCAWADHGSAGFAFFFNRTADDSATLFGQIRDKVLSRG